jgi:hypothetical protein
MAARLNPLFRPAQPTDFAGRLRQPEMRGPAYGNADPGMVVQPYADPGYALPNVDKPNLVQPEQQGQELQDIWRVGGTNSLTPWIESLPQALQMWDRLSPEQQAMYQAAYRAHSGSGV